MAITVNRRTFVKSCAVSAGGFAIGTPSPLLAMDTRASRWLVPLYHGHDGTLRDPQIRTLTDRALDAARSAGAQYADARVTYTRTRRVLSADDSSQDALTIGFSVRALVHGYWGRAVTAMLTEAEAVRVGRTAAANAHTLVKHGRERVVEWLPIPTVQNGDWTTPIEVDPFTVPLREVASFMDGEDQYAMLRLGMSWNNRNGLKSHFLKQDRVFASTEGSYGVQTRYISECSASLFSSRGAAVPLPGAGAAQAGWEHIRDLPWRTAMPALLEDIEAELRFPSTVPADVGRYDIVFDAGAMAALLGATIGSATSIGRALAYEANSFGTSYLGPHVLSILGTTVASPLVSVTANRSRLKALATVKWDDEGVTPDDFPLLKEGVLMDYQTTREQAPWLKEWYDKQGVPVRSHGCAASQDAHAVMRECTPNLEMHPGHKDATFDDLIAEVSNGLAVRSLGTVKMDWQSLNGLVDPLQCYTIRNGKRIARLDYDIEGRGPSHNAIMFRAPELLKSITMIGGAKSVQWANAFGDGYQPYSIGAVPAVARQMTIIDPSRRA